MSFTKFKVHVTPQVGLTKGARKTRDGDTSEQLAGHPSLAFLRTSSQSQIHTDTYASRESKVSSVSSVNEADLISGYLIHLTKSLLYIFSCRDFSNPLIRKHFSPSFSGKHDDIRSTKGCEDHLAVWTERMRSMPNFHEEIIDLAVDVGDGGKKARIWTLKTMSGIPPSEPIESRSKTLAMRGGVCKEGIAIVDWEVRAGVWMCMRVQMVWGVCEFS